MSNNNEDNKSKDKERVDEKELRDELDYLKDTLKNLQDNYESEVDVEYLEDDVLEGDEETPMKEEVTSTPFRVDLSDPKKIMDMIGKMGPISEKISEMFKPSETGEKNREGVNPMGVINSLIKNLTPEQKSEEVHEVIKINKEEMDDFSDTVAFILKSAGEKVRVKILNVLAERAHFTGELGSQVNLRGEDLRNNLKELDRTGLVNYSDNESKPHEITTYGRALINTMKKLFMNDFS